MKPKEAKKAKVMKPANNRRISGTETCSASPLYAERFSQTSTFCRLSHLNIVLTAAEFFPISVSKLQGETNGFDR